MVDSLQGPIFVAEEEESKTLCQHMLTITPGIRVYQLRGRRE